MTIQQLQKFALTNYRAGMTFLDISHLLAVAQGNRTFSKIQYSQKLPKSTTHNTIKKLIGFGLLTRSERLTRFGIKMIDLTDEGQKLVNVINGQLCGHSSVGMKD